MAEWNKNRVDGSNLNNGNEWTLDDQVAIEELNAMVNAGLYAQDFAEKLVENIDSSEAGSVGTPSVTVIDGDGATAEKPYKKFKFSNLKGEKGDKGDTGPQGQSVDLPIGMIFPSAVAQTDARFHALDGGEISTTGAYSEFVALLNTLYPNGDYTPAQYEADLTAYGQCGHFVIGTSTIRLPKITTFIEGLSDTNNLGTTVGAGLPNITGSIENLYKVYWNNATTSGAFDVNDTSGKYASGTESTTNSTGFNFDASKSNSIYGNSDTVQPQATMYPYYIVLANEYKTPVQVNLDNVMTDVNNKADKTGANIVKDSFRTALGIGDYVNSYSVLINAPTSTSWTTVDLATYLGDSSEVNIYEIILSAILYGNSSSTSAEIYTDVVGTETNPLSFGRVFQNDVQADIFTLPVKKYLYIRKSAYKASDSFRVWASGYRRIK